MTTHDGAIGDARKRQQAASNSESIAGAPNTPSPGSSATDSLEGAQIANLTEDECSRIVHASLDPARVLAGPDGHEGSEPDVLLTVVGEILAARLAQAEADAATDPALELAEDGEGASPDPSERVKLTEGRSCYGCGDDDVCSDCRGTTDDPAFRESILTARLAKVEAERDEYREIWERACARVGAASDRAEKADARADALAEQVAAVEALIPPDPELIEAGCSVLGQDLIAALSSPGAALARVRAEAGAKALEDAAVRASAELGWEKGGHTSTYSVRKWLRDRAADLRAGVEK